MTDTSRPVRILPDKNQRSQRIQAAADCLARRVPPGLNRKQVQNYLTWARRFPALLRRCGLSQSVALACQKPPAWNYLHDLSSVLGSTTKALADDSLKLAGPAETAEVLKTVSEKLADRSLELLGPAFRQLTRDVIAVADQLKRQAELFLADDNEDTSTEYSAKNEEQTQRDASAAKTISSREKCCRKELTRYAENPEQATHAGLVLDRLLQVPVPSSGKQKSQDQTAKHSENRLKLLLAASRAARSSSSLEVYRPAFLRWKQSLESPQGRAFNRIAAPPFKLTCSGRMVTGLGDASPFEIGIRLHHTYGVPWIPGSAIKGLCSHYCDLVWGHRDLEKPCEISNATPEQLAFRRRRPGDPEHPDLGRFHSNLFGTTESAGFITFGDAWLDPDSLKFNSGLVLDVITPHHQLYNQGEKRPLTDDVYAPSDFDSPTPIHYLSVTGTFYFSLLCDGPEETDGDRGALELAKRLLIAAVGDCGVGAKTSSGYGYMEPG